MIPAHIVEEVLSATKIEEVIGDSVKLTKKGVNMTGNCPFHNEKTGSFTVSASKGIFKCFGCGESGNAAGFLMKANGMTFPEAIKNLAARVNIEIKEKEQTPEEKAEDLLKIDLFKVNKAAMNIFIQLEDGPGKAYIQNRHSDEEIKLWNIGYSKTGYVQELLKQGYNEEVIIKAGLARRRDGRIYDFFIERVMYPVQTISGEVAGFTGRLYNYEKGVSKYSKYMNTEETPIFHKSDLFYGIYHGFQQMRKLGEATLVEGTTDVISVDKLLPVPLAALGTAFTASHAKILSRYVKKIFILGDGDEAGRKLIYRAGKLCLMEGLIVSIAILPDKEDPDSFLKNVALVLQEIPKNTSEEEFHHLQVKQWIKENKKDFVNWFATEEFENIKGDPSMKLTSIEEVCELLALIPEQKRQNIYIDEVANIGKPYKISVKQIKGTLSTLNQEDEEYVKELDEGGLPDYINESPEHKKAYYKYGFYEGLKGNDTNKYFFGPGNAVSNFIMVPIFHINSTNNTRKLFALKNCFNKTEKIDIDMQEMTSLNSFNRAIESKGNFLYEGDDKQFKRIRAKLYDNTKFCDLVENLGRQKTGFWAWSNGVQHEDGEWFDTNEDGIVEVAKKHYYIPAFSSVYIKDNTVYKDERRFRSINGAEITIGEWSEMMYNVYGNNGLVGIAFLIAALHRDFIMNIFGNFPMLNLFGPKGTGKSQMAKSLSFFFGESQEPFNIHNGTKAGLAEHLQLFVNALAIIEEYKNNIEFEKIETLKSIYDGTGRSRMKMDKGGKKETTMVNSSAIICGQEMPTADIALFSRVIFLQFNKMEFTDEEKLRYDKLKAIQKKGISYLTNQLVVLRKHFEQNFYINFKTIQGELNEKAQGIEDRVLNNWSTIIASLVTIAEKVDFSFKSQQLMEYAIECMDTQQAQMGRSNELGKFWMIMESAFDNNELINDWHFILRETDHISLTKIGNDGKSIVKQFEPRLVLKIKFNAIAKLYSENTRKMGEKPLPLDTLKYYLENQKYFLGVSKTERFAYTFFDQEIKELRTDTQKTSAYCFDYDLLGVNLSRETEEKSTSFPGAAPTSQTSMSLPTQDVGMPSNEIELP